MKKWFVFIVMSCLIIACRKTSEPNYEDIVISDGCYMGRFNYKGIDYWAEICFDKNRYEEWPSGGAAFQKSYGCLTIGTFSIGKNILTFKSDTWKFNNYPEPCVPDMILPGDYLIKGTMNNDSLIFEKGSGNSRIIYYLKKIH
jgi:hypothetical protein